MNAAYVDTSCVVAMTLDEPRSEDLRERLSQFDELFSANLLEAELRSALVREGVNVENDLEGWIAWVLPDRPLSRELRQTLEVGYLRGADLWHVATALFMVELPSDLAFMTLNATQAEVAGALGFPTGP